MTHKLALIRAHIFSSKNNCLGYLPVFSRVVVEKSLEVDIIVAQAVSRTWNLERGHSSKAVDVT